MLMDFDMLLIWPLCQNLLSLMKSEMSFLVSGHGLACQQEISLVLAKTLPIHYYTMIACSAITQGSCVFNAREHRVPLTHLYANKINVHDKCHVVIFVPWIETFIFIRDVIIQMKPMKWCNNIFTNTSCQWNAKIKQSQLRMRIKDEILCISHLQWCHNGWASNILIVVYAGIRHSKYWMSIHYDTIEDGRIKKSHLLFSNSPFLAEFHFLAILTCRTGEAPG